jgi:outer membrane protein assembly factor BamB
LFVLGGWAALTLPPGETPAVAAVSAVESHSARLIASPEPGWPQWRGPRRDGRCDETGLLPQWPSGGPPLRWKTTGLGSGYSAPIIVRDRIYLTGDFGETLRIMALDLRGQRLWESTNGSAWKGPFPGARSSCTYSDGRLYHLNAHGRLACLDAASGREIWTERILERFGGTNIQWALSECLVVDGPRVIVTPGGSRALMAALDKRTGATVWATTPPGSVEGASYASPILFELAGRRHIVSCSLKHAFGVDASTGQLLWTRPLPTTYSVIAATPVLVEDAVFVTAPDTEAGRLYRLVPEGDDIRVETLWSTPLDTCHGGLVYAEGWLFGSWYRRSKGWGCLDARTGALRHQIKDLAMGSVLYADGRFYCLSQEGEMALIKPSPDSLEFTGRFRLVPDRVNDAWTHPVIVDRKLYLRYQDTLFCYDVDATK